MLGAICCLSTDYCKGGCIGLSRNQNIKLTYNLIIVLVYLAGLFINHLEANDNAKIKSFNC